MIQIAFFSLMILISSTALYRLGREAIQGTKTSKKTSNFILAYLSAPMLLSAVSLAISTSYIIVVELLKY